MATTFESIVQRRIKEHLLNGNLKAVQAAKDFLDYSDKEFGNLLKPLFETENLTNETPQEKPQEKPPHNDIYEGTVIIRPGDYAIIDKNGDTLHEGGVCEYKTLNFKHGDHIQFKKQGKYLINITLLYNAVDTGEMEPINMFTHALVEMNFKTGELYVRKNINGETLLNAGSKLEEFYLRQFAKSKNINAGDTIDLFIKDNGYPYIHWAHHYDYQTLKSETPTKQSPKKTGPKSTEPKSNLDFDLTDKIIAVIGLPQTVRPNLIKGFVDEKKVKDLRIVDHDINYNTFVSQCDQAIKDADAVVIAKTGLNHAMSGYLVKELKKQDIPFAYANQPSFARIEMATYRALNHLAIDEISYNGDYPTIQ